VWFLGDDGRKGSRKLHGREVKLRKGGGVHTLQGPGWVLGGDSDIESKINSGRKTSRAEKICLEIVPK